VVHWEERISDTDEAEEKTLTLEINLDLSQQSGEICSFKENEEGNTSVLNHLANNSEVDKQDVIETVFPPVLGLTSSLSLSPQSPYATNSYWSNITLQKGREIHPENKENGYSSIDILQSSNQNEVTAPKFCDNIQGNLHIQAVDDTLEQELQSHSNYIANADKNEFNLDTAVKNIINPNKKEKRRKRKKITNCDIIALDHDRTEDILLFYINNPDENYQEPDGSTWILVSNEWQKKNRKKANAIN
jgi:hypothetical protein